MNVIHLSSMVGDGVPEVPKNLGPSSLTKWNGSMDGSDGSRDHPSELSGSTKSRRGVYKYVLNLDKIEAWAGSKGSLVTGTYPTHQTVRTYPKENFK